MQRLEIFGLQGFPILTGEGGDLVEMIAQCLAANDLALQDQDVLVVAQKVVSKAEGRIVDLRTVQPGAAALDLADVTGKPPALVEVILQESRRVVRSTRGHIITEHRLGYVCANAGVDMSNVAGESHVACLLPEDADASARRLRAGLMDRCGVRLAVIISDTHGRAWRNGAIGICIGIAGMEPLRNYRGEEDLYGRVLSTSQQATADELAAAASLVMGQGAEGVPVALVRGFPWEAATTGHQALIRPSDKDLFR